MITETRLTVWFVLGLISLGACGKAEKFEDRTLRKDGYTTKMTMIIWSPINRGEINSLNLSVQSHTKPRIHRRYSTSRSMIRTDFFVLHITEYKCLAMDIPTSPP
jgi:hypothetical protein